ncbi:hypothetical protein J6590_094502, partial [Homalodisca vitripennis]
VELDKRSNSISARGGKATLESQASLLPCYWLRDVTLRGGLRLNHLGVSHPASYTFTYFYLSLTPVYCEHPETFRTWLRAIHRDSYEVTSNSRVCIKHFDERYIIKEDTVTRPDGTILTVKRDRPKLRNDAVPTIFENLPNYIGKDLPAERKDPEGRRREAEERHQKQIQEEERRDTIDSFSCLTNNYNVITTFTGYAEILISFTVSPGGQCYSSETSAARPPLTVTSQHEQRGLGF